MSIIDKKKPVMVTGATGYIAGWIVKNLLENGFKVNAAVRDINNIDKIIYRGVEIRLNKELNSYLFNFHIKDLETLL